MLSRYVNRLLQRKAPVQAPIKATPADVLSNLYTAWDQARPGSYYFRDPAQLRTLSKGDQLPVPPPHLRMGYAVDSEESFLVGGQASAAFIRAILEEYGVSLMKSAAVMDWGCATGRALRHFVQEAQATEFWGVDQDEASIVWAKENLSPPFHFVTCTAYPHLPFQDNKFGLIYGLSVFTHLEHFPDLWLMELRRVTQPGGYAIFTIHDEHTVQFFMEHGRPGWSPADLGLEEIRQHESTIIHGDLWHQTYTFFMGDYVRKEWGRYFQVLGIRPYSDGYQSAVVLRKAGETK